MFFKNNVQVLTVADNDTKCDHKLEEAHQTATNFGRCDFGAI